MVRMTRYGTTRTHIYDERGNRTSSERAARETEQKEFISLVEIVGEEIVRF
jgi:hypothetical protein